MKVAKKTQMISTLCTILCSILVFLSIVILMSVILFFPTGHRLGLPLVGIAAVVGFAGVGIYLIPNIYENKTKANSGE